NLAQEVGVSRSVLAERFRQFLGKPPMTYLARWRLQLGAQTLTSTSYSVARISGEVGYESEPAFNPAFKREFGVPPARVRMQARSAERAVHTGKGQTDIKPRIAHQINRGKRIRSSRMPTRGTTPGRLSATRQQSESSL